MAWQCDYEELKAAGRNLEIIALPLLPRPPVPARAPPTLELVNWAVQMYCFCLLAHFREMLRSLLLMTEAGHIPAAFAVSRCLFEMGAHAYYVRKHVLQYLAARNLQAAWEFLSEINTGSRYMREEYGEEVGEAFPTPRDIAKVMRSFNEYIEPGWATTAYSFLSEFSHPNMAAFMHYFDWEKSPSGGNIEFIAPTAETLVLALPNVCIALVALLQCVRDLLVQAKESHVASQVNDALLRLVNEGEH